MRHTQTKGSKDSSGVGDSELERNTPPTLTDFETGSDVVFLVGQDPDVQRFPAHKKILVEKSPVFKAMFSGLFTNTVGSSKTPPLPLSDHQGSMSKKSTETADTTSSTLGEGACYKNKRATIAVSDVDGRAFDILLRYLYNESVQLQSVMTALTTLYAAHKYMCPGLAKITVKYLKQNLSSKNVLLVLQHICLYCNTAASTPQDFTYWELPVTDAPTGSASSHRAFPSTTTKSTLDIKPSAPPFEERQPLLADEIESSEEGKSGHITDDDMKEFEVGMSSDKGGSKQRVNCCQELLKDCLELVDVEGSSVLESEDMEDIDISALKMIICRETLSVKSEMEVYHAIVRWSVRECKRQKLELTSENRRKVLEGCQYLIRFLTLTPNEFQRCKAQGDLLTEEESESLAAVIKGECSDIFSPDHLSQCQSLMGARRKGRKVLSSSSLAKTKTTSSPAHRDSVFNRSRSSIKRIGRRSKSKDKSSTEVVVNRERKSRSLNEDKLKVEELKRRSKDKFSLLEEFFICLACIFD